MKLSQFLIRVNFENDCSALKFKNLLLNKISIYAFGKTSITFFINKYWFDIITEMRYFSFFVIIEIVIIKLSTILFNK